MDSGVLRIPYQERLTEDELLVICESNPEWRIERDKNGQLIIMSPVGSLSSNKNFRLNGIFWAWVEAHPQLGYAFDSSAGFTLPDKSMRSPDVSWVKKEKWEALTLEQQKRFAPVCPDFIIELRSESDSIQQLKSKMEEWLTNGCRIGWLIDPVEEKAYVYQPGQQVKEIIGFQSKIMAGPLLPGFELDLARLL